MDRALLAFHIVPQWSLTAKPGITLITASVHQKDKWMSGYLTIRALGRMVGPNIYNLMSQKCFSCAEFKIYFSIKFWPIFKKFVSIWNIEAWLFRTVRNNDNAIGDICYFYKTI